MSQVKNEIESTGGVLSPSTFIGSWIDETGNIQKSMVFRFNENKLQEIYRMELGSSFELFYDHIENLTMKYGKPNIILNTVVTDKGRHRNLIATWCIEKQELTVSGPDELLLWQLKQGCKMSK